MLSYVRTFALVALAASGCFYNPMVVASTESSTLDTSGTIDAATTPTTSAEQPTCGDGILEPGEQCDDGNDVNGDGCENDCTPTGGVDCGNGTLDPGEECDDGNDVAMDGCENNCTETDISANCGDGTVNGDDECDDGDQDNTDACTNTCKNAACGDGVVQAGVEECDDDNQDNTDACTNTCKTATCGDGYVQAGVEECDDDNNIDDDDCSNDCRTPRMVFVTYGDFKGNLGGLLIADAKCAQAAADAPLPANVEWLAWISDDTLCPVSPGRMDTSYTGYYKLTNGTVIAHGWNDLIDGSLLQPINIDETGAPLAEEPFAVWSNTTPAGLSAGTDDCADWSSAALATKGRYGDINAMDGGWSDSPMDNPIGCANSFHLYCFQNSPLP
ncbi:DUF4215 domain-containing protein [Nannocystis radixulma]|uniref:DUF4215 domain-containing protein n=1 Tax=Nannocystis radixulma TaxID=2995305 RepID=A0ABT5BNX9_9BACT|nr:DUF4215 domain-containing protein [Nannocystis radixulma]MDC0675874.1 DUF4215 domain-containing protein [Nannocystis radixulma]